MRCSESRWRQLCTRAYRQWGAPACEASIDIGSAIENVAEDGDVLTVTRSGTGDHAAILLRDRRLVMALGSVVGQLPADMAITEDPRLDEEHLYGVRRELGDPRTTFAWVDAEDRDLEATLQKLGTLPGPRLLIAHRALSAKENFELNARIAAAIDFDKYESRRYLPVDARFKTADEWQAYVRALPEKRPDDLHIQFTAPGTEVTLCEGQYAIRAPWHFYVHRVRRWGVPGQSSHIAVAQEHAQLDADMIRDSTRQIAAGAIRITH